MFSIYLISGVIGVMLFFSVAVAPAVFKVLPAEWAGTYVRHFFPKYYLLLGIVCVEAGIFAPTDQLKIISFVSAALFAISLWVLTPAINKAKDENKTQRFNQLHGASVVFNLVILGLLFLSFWL